MNQNKNIIVSSHNIQVHYCQMNCYAPVIYECSQLYQGNNNFLSKIKYTLNNSDIPYIDKNHQVMCLCEVDNFVVTGHA